MAPRVQQINWVAIIGGAVALLVIVLTLGTTLGRGFQQRIEETLSCRGLAMVRVEGDEDIILLRKTVGQLRQGDRPKGRVLMVQARGKLTGSGRELNDPVRHHGTGVKN